MGTNGFMGACSRAVLHVNCPEITLLGYGAKSLLSLLCMVLRSPVTLGQSQWLAVVTTASRGEDIFSQKVSWVYSKSSSLYLLNCRQIKQTALLPGANLSITCTSQNSKFSPQCTSLPVRPRNWKFLLSILTQYVHHVSAACPCDTGFTLMWAWQPLYSKEPPPQAVTPGKPRHPGPAVRLDRGFNGEWSLGNVTCKLGRFSALTTASQLCPSARCWRRMGSPMPQISSSPRGRTMTISPPFSHRGQWRQQRATGGGAGRIHPHSPMAWINMKYAKEQLKSWISQGLRCGFSLRCLTMRAGDCLKQSGQAGRHPSSLNVWKRRCPVESVSAVNHVKEGSAFSCVDMTEKGLVAQVESPGCLSPTQRLTLPASAQTVSEICVRPGTCLHLIKCTVHHENSGTH